MEVFSTYIALNLFVGVGLAASFFVISMRLPEKTKKNIHYGLLIGIFLAPILFYYMPEDRFVMPLPQTFDGSVISVKSTLNETLLRRPPSSAENVKIDFVDSLLVLLLVACWSMLGIRLCISTRRGLESLQKLFLIRHVGRLQVLVTEQQTIPYAFSFARRSFVVLPSYLLAQTDKFNIALKHEVQHIRQGDTRWAFFLQLFKIFFFINPFAYQLVNNIKLLQETSCDEALLARKKVSPRDYATCLLDVADRSATFKGIPIGAAGLTFKKEGHELKRRIKKMINFKQRRFSRLITTLIIMASVSFFVSSAFALKGAFQPGHLTLSQVKRVVNPSDFSFPIEVNEEVVKALNMFLSTKKGKAFTKKALARYETHKGLVQNYISMYGHPQELAALAFIESGYKNLPEKLNINKSAGVWQFIPGTARAYNLTVNDQIDERMDIPKATDAAMRYLGANYLVFNDWRLSAMAYNMGESRVKRAIMKNGTRDPWELIRHTNSIPDETKRYLPKLMAAAIIMKYPEISNL